MNRGLTIVLATLLVARASGQGCSDAGVCTAGPIGQLHLWQDSTADVVHYRHMARLGYSYAQGEQGTTIMQALTEVSLGIGERFSVQLKAPYVWVHGNLGEKHGIGDPIATVSYSIVTADERKVTAVAGLRFPAGRTDAAVPAYPDDGMNHPMYPVNKPLPMPYQTGLGTTDLLLGLNARRDRWAFGLAYQHVLSNTNANAFTHQRWSNAPDALGYFESNKLERKDDVVARVQYAYGCGRLALQPGLLAIYHVANDTRLEVLLMDSGMLRTTVEGSKGLTLNGTVDLRYKLSDRWAVEFSAGMPFVTRKARPDGLTREFVLNTGLRFRF